MLKVNHIIKKADEFTIDELTSLFDDSTVKPFTREELNVRQTKTCASCINFRPFSFGGETLLITGKCLLLSPSMSENEVFTELVCDRYGKNRFL